MNDMIYNWLKGYPGLELLQRQQVDAVPGGCGLFFRGVTVKDTRANLLGQTQKQKTLNFRLCRYDTSLENLLFFTMLEAWVQVSTASLGSAVAAAQNGTPSVGSAATAALKNGKCARDAGGLTLWEADLEITYWEDL